MVWLLHTETLVFTIKLVSFGGKFCKTESPTSKQTQKFMCQTLWTKKFLSSWNQCSFVLSWPKAACVRGHMSSANERNILVVFLIDFVTHWSPFSTQTTLRVFLSHPKTGLKSSNFSYFSHLSNKFIWWQPQKSSWTTNGNQRFNQCKKAF